MKNIFRVFFFLILFFIAILILVKCEGNEVSNVMHAWGFRREGIGKRPVLDVKANKIIEDYNGISIGGEDERIIYITFDAGYEAGYTEKILDVLKKHNVKASFFITGHYLNTASDLVKRMIEEGHIVGNQFPTMVMYHV